MSPKPAIYTPPVQLSHQTISVQAMQLQQREPRYSIIEQLLCATFADVDLHQTVVEARRHLDAVFSRFFYSTTLSADPTRTV